MESNSEKKDETMLDFLIRLLRWRRVIFYATAAGTALSIIIVLLIPNSYISFSTVRGNASSGFNIGSLVQSSGALSALGGLADIAMPQSGGEIDYLIAILNSNSVQNAVVEKFKLRERYNIKKLEDVREFLKGETIIKKNLLAETISIGVYDEDSVVAAEITRYFVKMLNKKYTEINIQMGKNNREHLENRYRQVEQTMSQLEDSLKIFQEKYGVYDAKTQTEAAIRSAAALKSEVILKEIEFGSKLEIFGINSPEIQHLKIEINQMNKAFDEMMQGAERNDQKDIFIPFVKAPKLGLAYLRLKRDIEIHVEIMKVLIPMLEQAKLQERRESPSVVVIDEAKVPEKKAKPFRSLIVLGSFIGSFFLVLLVAFMMEHLENIKVKNPERHRKLQIIYDTFKTDLRIKKKA